MSELASERIAVATADRTSSIQAILHALLAPAWARPNLDALADVLRDLSWLPAGPVRLRWQVGPELAADQREAIESVLRRGQRETAQSLRPVSVHVEMLG